MSLSSVLTTLVAVLGLANLVLVLRVANRREEIPDPGADGANVVAAPPPPAMGDRGAVAPDRRT
jgi:hypothetical protein